MYEYIGRINKELEFCNLRLEMVETTMKMRFIIVSSINYLMSSLKRYMVSAYWRRSGVYEPELCKGEGILPPIKEAILTASMHVAIFSPTYAQ